jgi:putative hemolysin
MTVMIMGFFVVLFLGLSFFCSLAEMSLFSLGRLRLDYLTKKGDRTAGLVTSLLREPDELISTILICNNIANTLGTILACAIAVNLLGKTTGFTVASVVMTLVLIFFCEMTPKIIGAHYSEKISFKIAKPVRIGMILTSPLVKFLTSISNSMFRHLGVKLEPRRPMITRDELKHFVKLSREYGYIGRDEHEMFHAVFSFHDKLVYEAMLPRSNMVAIDIKKPMDEIMRSVSEHGYTRYPVYEGNIDNIVGILYAKDLFNAVLYKEVVIIQDLLRKPFFVDKNMRISSLLRNFQKERFHMAIVEDEKGGIAGIITMEDIIEEIVGEIEDEYDIEK